MRRTSWERWHFLPASSVEPEVAAVALRLPRPRRAGVRVYERVRASVAPLCAALLVAARQVPPSTRYHPAGRQVPLLTRGEIQMACDMGQDASAPRGHLHFLKSGVLRGICTNSGVGSSFLVFSLLASNQDDYFRNHGFLIRVAGP